MRMLCLVGALAAHAALAPAVAQESPFAQTSTPNSATLADIMGLTQIRHEKLWSAGRAKNWDLAAYEIQQLRSTLVRSAVLYLNIPVELVVAADAPLESMLKAVKARDEKAFNGAFSDLTTACNACHMAGGVGFVRIVSPRASTFTNQDFTPRR